MKTFSARRPLSPHLQIYRPQLTSVLSILHRLTGIGFIAALCLTCIWLYALSMGETYYKNFYQWWQNPLIKPIFYGILASVYYHLLNGVRYLIWSIGTGYKLRTIYNSGWLIVASVFTLLLLTILLV